jgi:hypothetical protein
MKNTKSNLNEFEVFNNEKNIEKEIEFINKAQKIFKKQNNFFLYYNYLFIIFINFSYLLFTLFKFLVLHFAILSFIFIPFFYTFSIFNSILVFIKIIFVDRNMFIKNNLQYIFLCFFFLIFPSGFSNFFFFFLIFNFFFLIFFFRSKFL